jgi:hypothetical protein
MLGNRIPAAQSRCEHEANLALLDHVRGSISLASLRTRVSHQGHPKRGTVEVRGLTGIADVKLDVIRSLKRQEVRFVGCRVCGGSGVSHNAHWMLPGWNRKFPDPLQPEQHKEHRPQAGDIGSAAPLNVFDPAINVVLGKTQRVFYRSLVLLKEQLKNLMFQ